MDPVRSIGRGPLARRCGATAPKDGRGSAQSRCPHGVPQGHGLLSPGRGMRPHRQQHHRWGSEHLAELSLGGGDSWASILDDGFGMSESELIDAMRIGSRSPRISMTNRSGRGIHFSLSLSD